MILRRQSRNSNPVAAVTVLLNAAPWLRTFRFDKHTGWGAAYTDIAIGLAITGSANAGLTVGPGNGMILYNCNNFAARRQVFVNGFNFATVYATATQTTNGRTGSYQSVELNSTGTTLLALNNDNRTLEAMEYSLTTGMGTGLYTTGNNSQFLYGGRTIRNDARVIYGTGNGPTGVQIFTNNQGPFISQPPIAFGVSFNYRVAVSPIVHANGVVLAAIDTNGGVGLFWLNPVTSVFGAVITNTLPAGSVRDIVFDKYGRLFVSYTTPTQRVSLLTINSAGAQTLVGTTSANIGSVLTYDEDGDILFSLNGTTLEAHRMSGSSVGNRYSPPTLGATGVFQVALHYRQSWKSTNHFER